MKPFARRAALAACAIFLSSAVALAQTPSYPSRSVTFIVPFSAGAGADIVAPLPTTVPAQAATSARIWSPRRIPTATP